MWRAAFPGSLSEGAKDGLSRRCGGTLPVGEGKYLMISPLLSLDKSRKYI